MLKNAKKLDTAPAAKKSSLQELPVTGTRIHAAISMVIDSLKGIQKTISVDLHSETYAINVRQGMQSGIKPQNIRGIDGASSGSLQIKSRIVTSPFKADELAFLAEHNIPTKTHKVGVTTYAIDPRYVGDEKMMDKVEAALVAAGLPSDLFVSLEAKETQVNADNTIAKVFELAGKKDDQGKNVAEAGTIRRLLEIVTTPSITPNFGSDDVEAAQKVVDEYLNPKPVEAPVQMPVAANAEIVATPKKVRTKKAA